MFALLDVNQDTDKAHPICNRDGSLKEFKTYESAKKYKNKSPINFDLAIISTKEVFKCSR
jgi:hypothetical protein